MLREIPWHINNIKHLGAMKRNRFLVENVSRDTLPPKNRGSCVQFKWKRVIRVVVVYRRLMTRRLVWIGENWPLLTFGTPAAASVLTVVYTRFCLPSRDENFRVAKLLRPHKSPLNYSLQVYAQPLLWYKCTVDKLRWCEYLLIFLEKFDRMTKEMVTNEGNTKLFEGRMYNFMKERM